jgi:hypothetical protein
MGARTSVSARHQDVDAAPPHHLLAKDGGLTFNRELVNLFASRRPRGAVR